MTDAATACCTDARFLLHDLPGHPEGRVRLERIAAQLERDGLAARMHALPAETVDPDLLARVHSPANIRMVEQVAARGGGYLDPDTYMVERSYEAALAAAGGAAACTRAVLSGAARNAIALVRPPGHHATRVRGMGFCLFNNVAVAAQAALDEFGLERVLVVDWDVHHGNGTQDIFYESPQVLYFSTHQYPHYPGSGSWEEIGAGAGRGFNANVPLPAGVGDAGFARIFDEVLIPLAERYRPQLILVSAGYDAHWTDPLAGLALSLAGYWRMATEVVALAGRLCAGRVVVALEGGYNLDLLGLAVADTCRALLGDAGPGPDPFGRTGWPEQPVDRVLALVKRAHGL
jgi:acetoin utilization deacetylase AcuC-like enzyme